VNPAAPEPAEPGEPKPVAPIFQSVWQLAWPTMVSFGLQSVVSLVDFLIVGALGTRPLAAAGVAHQFHFVQFAVFAAVTTGTTALVARAWGAGEREEADRVLRLSAALGCALGAVLMALIPWADALVGAFGVEPDVVRVGGGYLRILLAFNVPFALMLVVSTGVRGAGDVRTPLVIGVLVNLVNVALNYGLVFGRLGLPELGVQGSALGTGIAFLVGAALWAGLWARNLLLVPRGPWLEGFTLPRTRRLLRIGLPTALEQAAWQGGLWLFLRLVAQHGTEPVSAYLIGVRILALSFVPGLGFMTASSTLVGQYLGAGQPEAAARSGWRATAGAMAVMGGMGLTIIAFSRPVAGWFGATGPETVGLTISFIHILGAAQPLMAVEFALGGALRGAGDTRFPLLAMLCGLFLFRLGGASLASRLFDASVVAVWSFLLADYAVKGGLLALRFASGRWQATRF
jgi:putative MATE family efflux protein